MEIQKRRYRRFKLRKGALVGRIDKDQAVDVIDIGVGGAGLKADRSFPVGSECSVRLEIPEGGVDVKGVIVRSRMAGFEEWFYGERAAVYASAIRFREGSEDQIADFICGALVA